MNSYRVFSQRAFVLLLVLGLGAAGGLFWNFPGSRPRDVGSTGSQRATEFEHRVRAYLLEHPEILVEALQRYETRQQAIADREASVAIDANADALLRDPDSPVGGNVKGDVSMVQFFDYNCRFCRQVAPHVTTAGATDPELRVVYKELPILGPASLFAAQAALAANRQGKYIQLHNALMVGTEPHTESTVLDAAGRVGLDIDRLKRDMLEPTVQTALTRNLALAQALRISGTPAFVIGTHIERGAADPPTLRRLVEAARQKK